MINAFEPVRQALLTLNPQITSQEWTYFEKGLIQHDLAPKDFFMQADQPNYLLGFLTKGLIRGFYRKARSMKTSSWPSRAFLK